MDKAALIGSDTLLGREIRDLWPSSPLSKVSLSLIAAEEQEVGKLTKQGSEPVFINPLAPVTLAEASFAILAGTLESSKQAISLASKVPLIDLTYAAEDHPQARVRAPLIEKLPDPFKEGHIHVIAHPAAIVLATVLTHINDRYPIARSIVNIFEPASERGQGGVEEIQQQTVSLLSFKGLPKDIFDAQAAFAMLAAFGEEAPESLESIELRIERHLATLLSGWNTPMPSFRLVQAPVFHGHSFSIWMEFTDNPGARALEKLLSASIFDVRDSSTEPPNNVGIAGQSEVAIGAIRQDRNNAHAYWLWAAADNIRIRAENAVAVARELM